jgi:hypothetical protein
MLQVGSEREKFIFYRGLARFNSQPLKVTAQSSSQITLHNISDDQIGFALVYEYKNNQAKVWWSGEVKANSSIEVKDDKPENKDKAIYKDFLNGLVKAGLYKKEASSMLETWRHSYFEKDGLRVFWVVPRKFTDKVLPLKLDPAPKNLERVLVGRTEVLTPEFEEKLATEFVTNTNGRPFWFKNSQKDRFFIAWKQRAKEILNKKSHQFSFLKKISERELPYGEIYTSFDEKKDLYTVNLLPYAYTPLLTFSKKENMIDGKVTYKFQSASSLKTKAIIGFRNYDREAVFSMKNGKLNGECKIFNLALKGRPVIETRQFKEGEVL